MNKNFSFYEFTGIITPSVILLYFLDLLLKKCYSEPLFDFSKLGESVVFFIIAYGLGQVLHSIGNLLENAIWLVFNGKPTNWLTKAPRFSLKLFDAGETKKIIDKLHQEFGKVEGKDYGMLAYSKVYSQGKSERIDIFNGNYSMFRGLSVSFMILAIGMLWLCLGWWAFWPFVFSIMALSRMIRFGKYYAKEVFRMYMMLPD